MLHELQGLSPVEIADIVGAPVLTVRTRLFYARRELISLIGREATLSHLFAELGEEAVEVEGSPGSAVMENGKSQSLRRGDQ